MMHRSALKLGNIKSILVLQIFISFDTMVRFQTIYVVDQFYSLGKQGISCYG
jgi:hypothetical protein